MKKYFFVIMFMLATSAAGAEQGNKEKIFQRMFIALVDGQCSVVLQKQYQVSASGSTEGSYIADNFKLHECVYIKEMIVSPCLKLKACPTYILWIQQNSDFSPTMPRDIFIHKLGTRQYMIREFIKANKN